MVEYITLALIGKCMSLHLISTAAPVLVLELIQAKQMALENGSVSYKHRWSEAVSPNLTTETPGFTSVIKVEGSEKSMEKTEKWTRLFGDPQQERPREEIGVTEAYAGGAPFWGHACRVVLNVNFYNRELPGKSFSWGI